MKIIPWGASYFTHSHIKQHTKYESLIAKPFDENTVKTKTVYPIQVKKIKKSTVLVVSWPDMHFSFASSLFLCHRSDA